MKALLRWAAWSVATALSLSCSAASKPDRDADAPLTAASSCRTRAERCNAKDDDCDGIIDERADPSCGLAHAAASCLRGRCVIDRCSEGFFDCNDIMSDGCETKGECGATCAENCDASVMPSESMTPNPEPDASSVDAATKPTDAASPAESAPSQPEAGQQSTAEPDEADGGEDLDASQPQADAGTCKSAAPSGQGPACDQCLCDACPEALAACTGTDDDKWNTLCGNVLACFGKSVQAGLCTGDDSDCFQNGDGPCAREFRAAFELGWICTADPVRTPCGALTRVRLECFRNQCAAVCKA